MQPFKTSSKQDISIKKVFSDFCLAIGNWDEEFWKNIEDIVPVEGESKKLQQCKEHFFSFKSVLPV